MNRSLLAGFLCLACLRVAAQTEDTDTTSYGMRIMMDEVVIKAVRKGWDLDAFIHRMKTDTTFYKAFTSLKVVAYESENRIRISDEHNRLLAALHNNTSQTVQNGCRTVKVNGEQVSGKYYTSGGNPRYYTAEMFQRLFFNPGTECGISDLIRPAKAPQGKLEKNKEQLKQLVFNPGSRIGGIPFVGDKASVFEPETAKMYDFHLKFELYEGQECYLFQAIPKPEYADKVVFNKLDTWFRTSDYSIMARDYALSYRTMVYDFDVVMKVRLEQVGARLLPATIEYQGNWHVISKKRERSVLQIRFDY